VSEVKPVPDWAIEMDRQLENDLMRARSEVFGAELRLRDHRKRWMDQVGRRSYEAAIGAKYNNLFPFDDRYKERTAAPRPREDQGATD
jgi:hypothetical protein